MTFEKDGETGEEWRDVKGYKAMEERRTTYGNKGALECCSGGLSKNEVFVVATMISLGL